MSSEISEFTNRVPELSLPRARAVLLAAALLITACQGGGNPEQAIAPTTPPNADEIAPITSTTAEMLETEMEPAEQCPLFRRVTLGEYFTTENLDKIDEQLDLLATLHVGTKPLEFDDIKLGAGIINAARIDPLYAEAIVVANDAIGRGEDISAEAFLELPVSQPRRCDDHSISKEDSRAQSQRIVVIGGFVVRRSTGQLAEQAGAFARETLEAAGDYIERVAEELQTF